MLGVKNDSTAMWPTLNSEQPQGGQGSQVKGWRTYNSNAQGLNLWQVIVHSRFDRKALALRLFVRVQHKSNKNCKLWREAEDGSWPLVDADVRLASHWVGRRPTSYRCAGPLSQKQIEIAPRVNRTRQN